MSVPDLVNGGFEFFSSLMTCLNIKTLYKDKQVRGVHIVPTTFFFSWGLWNLFYYPHLNQWLSFYGGLAIVTANGVWVLQMLYYKEK